MKEGEAKESRRNGIIESGPPLFCDMLAHIVTTYDVKLEIEGVRPPDM